MEWQDQNCILQFTIERFFKIRFQLFLYAFIRRKCWQKNESHDFSSRLWRLKHSGMGGGGSTSGTRGTREAETRRDKEASLSRTYNVLARNTCFQHVIKTTNQRREVSIHLSKKKKSPLWREWGRCLWRKDGNLRALPLLGKIWETNYYHFIFKTFKSWLIKKIYSETNFWYIQISL